MAVEQFFDFILENPKWIAIGLGVYVVIYAISTYFFGRKPGRNPFAVDHRRPKQPLITDPVARDAILKQRFKPGKVPDNLDVIIVGSGAGGLVTGVMLAQAGKSVLVLEQHDQAGGCCHTFTEKGYEFDTGIHYIGDMNGTFNRDLLDQLTGGQLDWAPMDLAFDTVALGDPENARRYPMHGAKERFFENIIDFFPSEREAIMKYKKLILDADAAYMGIVILKVLPKWLVTFLLKTGLVKVFFRYLKYSTVTLQESLDKLTDNDELKTVLCYICGDYGVLPKDVPVILHSTLTRHYWNGAYYPVGGPSEITIQLVSMIDRLGGRVLVQAPVSEILINDEGRAVGVRVTRSSGSTDIHAKSIVSDAGAINTFKKLLPPDVAKTTAIYPMIETVGPSLSFITGFFGVDAGQDDIKLPSGNTWYYTSNNINKVMGDFLQLTIDDIAAADLPLCYISFPSAKDPTFKERHPGKSCVLVITLAKWEWFEEWQHGRLRHRGERYEEIKNAIGNNMWRVCCNLFPQLEGKRDYMEVGTPVTNKHYLGQPMGELYGLDQGLKRFDPEVVSTMRAETGIPGLYMAGQDLLMCGFAAVLGAGLLTASAILKRNLMSDFGKRRAAVMKERKEQKKQG